MKRDFQKLFLDTDGPVAAQILEILESLSTDSPSEESERAGFLCHRLRGDARTVGFALIGELAGVIEDELTRNRRQNTLADERLVQLRFLANEISRRISGGRAACQEPLSHELQAMLQRYGQD
ncbi:MAG: Hpt domain-containing protein [Myxococcales bacterium]